MNKNSQYFIFLCMNQVSFSQLAQNMAVAAGALVLPFYLFSAASAAEISDDTEDREYVQSVYSECSPQFSDITPEKYSDIGELETLSFTLSNNANPDSMSVKINEKQLPFSLRETAVAGIYSGSIDVSGAKDGRQIVSLYAQSNDAIRCSFRDYIYVLYKNYDPEFPGKIVNTDTVASENIHIIDPLENTGLSTEELSREKFSGRAHITAPSLDSTIFTISQDGEYIEGTAPKGAKKIWIDFSDEEGNTEHYFLRKFSEGDTTWKYFASSRYKNLSRGLNTYRVYAEFENGEFSESETLILFFPPENSTDPFVDTIGHWAEDSVTFLRSKGIVHGRVKNELFVPDGLITKAESLKISTLSFNVKKQKFEKDDFLDVDASDWFADYASTAKNAELEQGDVLNPHENIAVGEAEMLIENATGRNNVSVEFSSSEVTRAEFADQVVKLMK